MAIFQVLSRNNDVNGNPYRLVLVFDGDAGLVEAHEARSSSPNIVGRLHRVCAGQLPTIHMAPRDYHDMRAWAHATIGVRPAD